MVRGQRHAPAALYPPEKTRYTLYKRPGGSQDRSRQVRKISPTPGFETRTVEPVASRYADWATRPILFYIQIVFYFKVFVGNMTKKSPHKFNPLKPELNSICYLLALLGAHHFLHVSRIRIKLLTLRWLMSYIYGAPILDVSRSHTTTQHSR